MAFSFEQQREEEQEQDADYKGPVFKQVLGLNTYLHSVIHVWPSKAIQNPAPNECLCSKYRQKDMHVCWHTGVRIQSNAASVPLPKHNNTLTKYMQNNISTQHMWECSAHTLNRMFWSVHGLLSSQCVCVCSSTKVYSKNQQNCGCFLYASSHTNICGADVNLQSLPIQV